MMENVEEEHRVPLAPSRAFCEKAFDRSLRDVHVAKAIGGARGLEGRNRGTLSVEGNRASVVDGRHLGRDAHSQAEREEAAPASEIEDRGSPQALVDQALLDQEVAIKASARIGVGAASELVAPAPHVRNKLKSPKERFETGQGCAIARQRALHRVSIAVR